MGRKDIKQIVQELGEQMSERAIKRPCNLEGEQKPACARPQPKTPSGAPNCLYYFSGSVDNDTREALESIVNICEINRFWPYIFLGKIGDVSSFFRVPDGDKGTLWAEDYFHIFKDGTVKTAKPCVVSSEEGTIINVIMTGQTQRLTQAQNKDAGGDGGTDFEQLNLVLTPSCTSNNMIADEISESNRTANIFYMDSVIDGGNALPGEDFILIGKDALYLTGDQNGLDDKTAKSLIASELGYHEDRVFFVEQPGTFHLDLNMMLLGKAEENGPERVVVAKSYYGVDLRDIHEELCDLGFYVIVDTDNIVAKETGRLSEEEKKSRQKKYSRESHWQYNFFNGEFVRDDQNKLHYITNGVSEEIQAAGEIKDKFIQFLKECIFEDIEVHFLDTMTEKELNSLHGGVGCRFKGGPLEARNVLYWNAETPE